MTLDDTMAELHTKLAEELLARVRSGSAHPSDLKTALQFLKEHGITAEVSQGDPTGLLAQQFDRTALPFDATGTGSGTQDV